VHLVSAAERGTFSLSWEKLAGALGRQLLGVLSWRHLAARWRVLDEVTAIRAGRYVEGVSGAGQGRLSQRQPSV